VLLFSLLFLSTNFSTDVAGVGDLLVRLSCSAIIPKQFEKLLVIKIVTDAERGNREVFKHLQQNLRCQSGKFSFLPCNFYFHSVPEHWLLMRRRAAIPLKKAL